MKTRRFTFARLCAFALLSAALMSCMPELALSSRSAVTASASPPTPTAFSLSVQETGRLRLNWSHSGEALSYFYLVRKSLSSGVESRFVFPSLSATDRSFTDANVPLESAILYELQACNATHACSPRASASLSGFFNQIPTVPTAFSGSYQDATTTQLNWAHSGINASYFYITRRSTLPGQPELTTALPQVAGSQRSVTDRSVPAGAALIYDLQACNAQDRCSPRVTLDRLTGVTSIPPQPTQVTATLQAPHVVLSWSATSAGVAYFYVQRSPVFAPGTPALSGSGLYLRDSELRSYRDLQPPIGQSTVYTVAACNSLDQCLQGVATSPILVPTNATLTHNGGSRLGTNLTGLYDHFSEAPFVDFFKKSRPWEVASGFDDVPLTEPQLDPQGWVRYLTPPQQAENAPKPTAYLWSGQVGSLQYPGVYTVKFRGKGRFRMAGTVIDTEQLTPDSSGVYTTSVPVLDDPERRFLEGGVLYPEWSAMGVTLLRVDADYLREIRVFPPGGSCSNDEFRYCSTNADCTGAATCVEFQNSFQTRPFHPHFLEKTRPYKGLRFMDWMFTNFSTQELWENRPKPSDAQYTRKGAPLEVMLDLSRRLNADPWFCMGHKTNPDYWTQFARLVNLQLAPGLKAYIEHSNEIWNDFTFRGTAENPGQATFVKTRGLERNLNYDLQGNWLDPRYAEGQVVAAHRYHAEQSSDIFRAFDAEIANPRQRLVRVLGAHVARPHLVNLMLQHNYRGTATLRFVDQVAVGPYLEGNLNFNNWNYSLSTIFQFLRGELNNTGVFAGQGFPTWIGGLRGALSTANAQLALSGQSRRIGFVAYEGGQHLVGGEAGPAERFLEANRHPEMGNLLKELLNAWRDQDGGMFFHFVNISSPARSGSWGALERQNLTLAPGETGSIKYRALIEWINENRMQP